jgi:hypothetical protein
MQSPTTIAAPAEFNELYQRTVQSLGKAFSAFSNQGTRGIEIQARAKLQHRGWDLGSSIRFRLHGILVHLDFLYADESSALEYLSNHLGNDQQCRAMLRDAATRQRHLFDDIAFGVVSAFDYFGNYVGLVNYGEPRRKMKWEKLIEYAKKPELEKSKHGSTRIHQSIVAQVALDIEQHWLGKFAEYRADAIHYRADEVDGHMTIQWSPSPQSVAFHAHVAPEFVRWMGRARSQPPNLAPGASLIPCAEWLAEQTLVRMASLGEALYQDIGPDPLGTNDPRSQTS